MSSPPHFPSGNSIKVSSEILISSSLSLQIALFLNVYLAPIWASLSIYHLYVNADLENNEEDYESVLSVIFLTIAIPLEVVRLYLGYSGNLREKVGQSMHDLF